MSAEPVPAVGRFAGRHVLAEFRGLPAAVLDDVARLRHALEGALRSAGATVCQVVSQRFVPQGVTVLALLSESHASVHSYPEVGAMFVDVFTCGEQADPELAVRLLADTLGCADTATTTVLRGVHEPVTA